MKNKWVYLFLFLVVVIPFLIYAMNPLGVPSYDPRGRLLGHIPFRIPSAAMAPTLVPNDFILVSTLRRRLKLGDIIVFNFPLDPSVPFTKRVIGVGGDRIEYKDGVLVRNGAAVREPYVVSANAVQPFSVTLEEIMVPEGELFVLGDNRDNSRDSRFWGFVKESEVIGKAVYIWLSDDWERVGPIGPGF